MKCLQSGMSNSLKVIMDICRRSSEEGDMETWKRKSREWGSGDGGWMVE